MNEFEAICYLSAFETARNRWNRRKSVKIVETPAQGGLDRAAARARAANDLLHLKDGTKLQSTHNGKAIIYVFQDHLIYSIT